MSGAAVTAVRDFGLSIRPGEIFGLVGESGAGKTTLARALLRLPPEPGRIAAGEIRLAGRDLMALDETEMQRLRGRDLSMIVPNPRAELNPLLSVGEQITTMARVHLRLPAAKRGAWRSICCAPCRSLIRSGGWARSRMR